MATTYELMGYADGAAVQTALDKAGTALQPGLNAYFAKTDPWSVAWSVTGVNGLVTAQAMHIEVNGLLLVVPAARSITTPASPVAGTDYAIWCHPDGTMEATANHIAAPMTGARKVGGYYYAPGGNATAQAGGNTTPAINPYSCWDLHFRPKANDPRGMTLVAGHFWADIHLLNTNPDVNGTSLFGATIADGDSPPKIPAALGGDGSANYGSLTWFEAATLLGCYGKRLPTYQEFMLLAFGVTEATSFGNPPTSTALDAPRTSRWGVMQATGNMWIWGNDLGGPYAAGSWTTNTDDCGSTYNLPNVGLLGGHGNDDTYSGSRCSLWNFAPSASNNVFGARGVCDLLILG